MILLSGLALMYAEAPELRYVIPNRWRKVTRLSPVEETAFLQANRAIEDTIKTKTGFNSRFVHPSDTLDHTLVYKQTAGIDEFYRMILAHEQEPDFMSAGQVLFRGWYIKKLAGIC
jgi:hypothetical protein